MAIILTAIAANGTILINYVHNQQVDAKITALHFFEKSEFALAVFLSDLQALHDYFSVNN